MASFQIERKALVRRINRLKKRIHKLHITSESASTAQVRFVFSGFPARPALNATLVYTAKGKSQRYTVSKDKTVYVYPGNEKAATWTVRLDDADYKCTPSSGTVSFTGHKSVITVNIVVSSALVHVTKVNFNFTGFQKNAPAKATVAYTAGGKTTSYDIRKNGTITVNTGTERSATWTASVIGNYTCVPSGGTLSLVAKTKTLNVSVALHKKAGPVSFSSGFSTGFH